MNTQFQLDDKRMNGSKVTAFFSKSKMTAAAILFGLKINFRSKQPVRHYIMNTQFEFGNNRLNGYKVTMFFTKFKMAAAAILF